MEKSGAGNDDVDNSCGEWGYRDYHGGRPLTQVNKEQYSTSELEWGYLKNWRPGSEVEGYLVIHEVGADYREAIRPEECDVFETSPRMGAARKFHRVKGRCISKFESTLKNMAIDLGDCENVTSR